MMVMLVKRKEALVLRLTQVEDCPLKVMKLFSIASSPLVQPRGT